MIYWGINALNHGSSLAVFSKNDLVFFETSKNDTVDQEILINAKKWGDPQIIHWYENPWKKKLRQFHAGQYSRALTIEDLPRLYLIHSDINYDQLIYTPHHGSHAAAGYYTSPFQDAAVVVLDAIGEFECASIWHGQGQDLKKIWSRRYPNSLGLFYSAFTDLIGYRPIIEEYRLQQDSDLGNRYRYYNTISNYFKGTVDLKENFHKGVKNWPFPIYDDQDRYDIAAAVQGIFEEQVDAVMNIARELTGSNNLVYMGGCAMNSKYNQRLEDQWHGIWSLPGPGDYSSAIGAVLFHTKKHIEWSGTVARHIKIKYNNSI